MSEGIEFPSGLAISHPKDRLFKFCKEEYDYYDAIPLGDPNCIEPIDVLATVSMNSFISDAARVRKVHRGMAEKCNDLLKSIPVDARLLSSESPYHSLYDLLHAAVQADGVLIPVATKVLHRKRPHLIPMLDNVVLDHYLKRVTEQAINWGQTQNKKTAASVAVKVLDAFRSDLAATNSQVVSLQAQLAEAGYQLSLVRIVEVLVWTQVESRGYYRGDP